MSNSEQSERREQGGRTRVKNWPDNMTSHFQPSLCESVCVSTCKSFMSLSSRSLSEVSVSSSWEADSPVFLSSASSDDSSVIWFAHITHTIYININILLSHSILLCVEGLQGVEGSDNMILHLIFYLASQIQWIHHLYFEGKRFRNTCLYFFVLVLNLLLSATLLNMR